MNKMLKNKGFTLIEMMIVIIIIGVLAAIAYPLYTKYIEDGRIQEGKALLMNDAQYMQRWYLDKGTFAGAVTSPAKLPSSESGVGSMYYTIATDGTLTGTEFKLKATPTSQHTTTDYLIVDQDNNLKSCTTANVCSNL